MIKFFGEPISGHMTGETGDLCTRLIATANQVSAVHISVATRAIGSHLVKQDGIFMTRHMTSEALDCGVRSSQRKRRLIVVKMRFSPRRLRMARQAVTGCCRLFAVMGIPVTIGARIMLRGQVNTSGRGDRPRQMAFQTGCGSVGAFQWKVQRSVLLHGEMSRLESHHIVTIFAGHQLWFFLLHAVMTVLMATAALGKLWLLASATMTSGAPHFGMSPQQRVAGFVVIKTVAADL